MPKSCKNILNKMIHKGAMTQDEYDKVMRNLPKHGRWEDKYNDGNWHCSRCGAIIEKNEQDLHNWYWCYHCGARMDGEEDEER